MIYVSLMAASLFAINLVSGGALSAATGIPMANDILTAFTIGLWDCLLIKTLPRFGTFTAFYTIYSILELPTTLGGAPGFWPKVPINAFTGLIADTILRLAGYREWSIYVVWYSLSTVNVLVFLWVLHLMGVPGIDTTFLIVHWIILSYWVFGTIGIVFGSRIFSRIRDWPIVRILQ